MPPRFGYRPAALYLVFILLSIIVFSASFDNPFRDDDFVFIRHIKTNSNLSELLRPNPDFVFYRPGAILLFGLEMKLFGVERGGNYLLFNYLIHTINSLLLILVLLRLPITREAGYLSGGLFVLGFGHYGKQVMWACTSGPLCAILLVTLSLFLALKYSENSEKKYLLLTMVIAVIAPAFHEIGLTAPVLVSAVWWLYGTDKGKRWVLLALTGSVLILWFSLYAMVSGSYQSYSQVSGMVSQIPGVFIRFLGFMCVPIQQSDIMEQHPSLFSLILRISGAVQFAPGILIVATTSLVYLGCCRQYKLIVIWLYVALIPFCFIRLPENWLELRYVYFASMPFCALFAAAMTKIFVKFDTRVRTAVVVLLLLLSGMTSYVVCALENQYDTQAKSDTNTRKMEGCTATLSRPGIKPLSFPTPSGGTVYYVGAPGGFRDAISVKGGKY